MPSIPMQTWKPLPRSISAAPSRIKNAVGRMSSVLKPVADRYNQKHRPSGTSSAACCAALSSGTGYVSQVARMFDEELHKENVFCAYLLKLLPPDEVSPLDLEGKLQLEYYKLQKTFAGAIELEHAKGVCEPVTQRALSATTPREPLGRDHFEDQREVQGRVHQCRPGAAYCSA